MSAGLGCVVVMTITPWLARIVSPVGAAQGGARLRFAARLDFRRCRRRERGRFMSDSGRTTQRVRRALAESGSIGGGEAAKLDEAEAGCVLGHGWRVASGRGQDPARVEQAQPAQVAIGRGAMHGAEVPKARGRADAGDMTDFCNADRLFRMPACQ